MKLVGLLSLLNILILGYIQQVSTDSPQLLLANRKEIYLVNSTTHGRSANTTTLVSGYKDAVALDFYWRETEDGRDNSTVCWSDVTLESISCASLLQLDNPVTIAESGVVSPDGLRIDWIGGKIYWIDSFINRIEVCDMDGKHRKVLFWTGLDLPRGLALDPHNGYMYWTDWGEVAKIERGGMNGDNGTRTTIISDNITWPNGITIDYEELHIYWVDAKLQHLHRADLDGKNRVGMLSGVLPHPFAVTVFKENLYWTDWKNMSIFSCNKHRCDTTVGTVLQNIDSPMDLQVYNKERQPREVVNACLVNNGGCSDMCLLAPAGSNPCACPTGIKLLEDGKTCADGPSQMIFLARRMDIRMISLDLPDYTDTVVEVENIEHAIAIDYDPVESYVYWTDDELRLIQRAYTNGSNEEAIVSTELMNPDGIAVDWISRNIFWTDTGTDRIEVARLNGSSRHVILSDNLDEPRAIAVDPVGGWMFWTDWGEVAKIERAAMDGTQRKVLIDQKLEWPNGVAIDFEFNCLYWADAKMDKIERANYDGSDRTVVVESSIPHVFGFDLVGQYLYWTDWQRRVIERAHKRNPGLREVIVDQLPDLMGLRAVNMTVSNQTNECAINDGGCSHLCLNTPNRRVCACPHGMELLEDMRSCIVPEAFLIFSQPKDIRRVSIQTRLKDTPIHIGNLANITSLDMHVNQGQLYFSDRGNKSIRHAYVNGSTVRTVTKLIKESPSRIALDWISQNLYFIEANMKRIEVFHLNTSARRVIVWQNLTDPRDMVVHPTKGYIFYSDWGINDQHGNKNATISRARLDGEEQSVIIRQVKALSLNIDFSSQRIFWINVAEPPSIQSASLDGTDLRIFHPNLTRPHAMTIYQSFIYWFDLQEKNIYRASKRQPLVKSVVQTGIDTMVNLLAYHKTRQPGWTRCGHKDNGKCQYFCFSTGRGTEHKCACPTHYTLNADGLTCSAPNSFLLLSERSPSSVKDMQIKRLTGEGEPDIVLPMKHLRNIRTLEYDPYNSQIYWIDGKSRTVKRSNINGDEIETFLPNGANGIFSPVSMALDPFALTLFWSDSENNYINVTSLDKKVLGVIVNEPELRPRAVAIHANKGYLFFISEDTQRSKVFRTTLDGKNMKVIVKDAFPVAIAVDTQGDRLYWSDHGDKDIKSSNISGLDVRIHVSGVEAITLAVYHDRLYYATVPSKLNYMDIQSGKRNKENDGAWGDITDVLAVNGNTLTIRRNHPCRNHDCSHICYVTETLTRKCGCPEGLVLGQNQLSCGPVPTCKPTQFTCVSGSAPCIPIDWRCDGTPECSDGSDEEDCPNQCEDTEFRCSNGECIDKSRYCDQVADCADSSDEFQEKCCAKEQFLCSSDLSCIPESNRQDGIENCPGGEDEKDITTVSVAPSSQPSDPYKLGIIIVVCIVFVFILSIIAFALWKCRTRNAIPLVYDNVVTIQPLNSMCTESMGTNETGGLPHPLAHSVTATTVISDTTTMSAGAYDRNHVTGASSSSSSMTHLQAGYNPPPSPVTERSAFVGHHSPPLEDDMSTIVSGCQPYPSHPNTSRRMHAPPTTPISTCDDSEPSVVNFSTQRPRTRKKSNRKYQLLKGGEPCPPPPTPTRSQIFSMEDGSECPPSPSTVRSFRSNFNPYPPPPSPEPTSDNS